MGYGATVPNILIISSGNGNLASTASLPYRISSRTLSFALSTLVESIVIVADGLCPGTGTGIVLTSHENVIASGLSFMEEYCFCEGEALAP